MEKFIIKFNQSTNFFWTNNIFLALQEDGAADKLLYAIHAEVNFLPKENIVNFTFSNNESKVKKLTVVEGANSNNERMYYSFALLRKGEQSLKGTGVDKLLKKLKTKEEDQVCFTNFEYSLNNEGNLVLSCKVQDIFVNQK